MISDSIGWGGKLILTPIVRVLSYFRINPNLLTFMGAWISFWAAWQFGHGRFSRAGFILILAGLFDMLDGEVARVSGRASRFGAFYDSVIDRYSDIIILQGLMVWYARNGRLEYVVLVGVVFMGAVMTSYARARAESLIPTCKVGFMERPERIVLLIIGALSNRMEAVLWVLALLGNWTVITRIYYTWKELPRLQNSVNGVEHQAPEKSAQRTSQPRASLDAPSRAPAPH